MANAAYYRDEAERCRNYAAANPEAHMKTRWLQLAKEYDQLAEALNIDRDAANPAATRPQPQPMQQAQQKAKEEE
jgi:hypothetical protein